MSRPTLGDYSIAIQNPNVFLKDSALKACSVELDQFGSPRPRTGGFAVTFRLTGGAKSWAVRCFHKEVGDLAQRYVAINRVLSSSKSSLFVDFEYQPDGILVNGNRWPVLKMEWVEGQTLQGYLEDHHSDAQRVRTLLDNFRNGVSQLERMGVAHGDLQHGNIVVRNDQCVLVDYDGMYVPSMGVAGPREMGHANYQSPLRDKLAFGADLDRFSTLVIALGLEALIQSPDLWKKYSTGDNILFVSNDFADPSTSLLIKDLRSIPSLRQQVDQFEILCKTPLDRLPKLEDFLAGHNQVTRSAAVAYIPAPRRQWELIDGRDRATLMTREGDQVEVFGRITEAAELKTRHGEICWALNFGHWKKGDFRLMVWQPTIDRFARTGITRHSLHNRPVKITGMVQLYTSKYGQKNPQIIVWNPSELQFITEGEIERLRIEATAPAQLRSSGPDETIVPPTLIAPPKTGTGVGDSFRVAQPFTPDKTGTSSDGGPNNWDKSTASPGNNTWAATHSDRPNESISDKAPKTPLIPNNPISQRSSTTVPNKSPHVPDVPTEGTREVGKRNWWKFWR